MALAVALQPAEHTETEEPIRRHLFTREEYYALAEAGILGDRPRLELIDGEVFEKMAPQRTPHTMSVLKTERELSKAFDGTSTVRYQLPITLSNKSEPEPDVCVAKGSFLDYAESHPQSSDIQMVVEVSDTTVRLDRKLKARLYGVAGIPEYWIVNLGERRLEVFRDPSADLGYRTSTIYAEADSVTPLGAPHASILVADLLP